MHLNDLMISMSEQIHAGQHERSMDALSPCIAGGALAAIYRTDSFFFLSGRGSGGDLTYTINNKHTKHTCAGAGKLASHLLVF